MALDPQAQAVIDLVIKSGRPAYNTLSPKDARQLFRETRPASTPTPPEIGAVRNLVAQGPGGPIPLRVYRPAVVALQARDAGAPVIKLQVLVYPVTDVAAESRSYQDFSEGYMLTRESMRWFTAHYLAAAGQANDWRVSPLRASSHAGLPPALVVTAGFDPLRDEGAAYAAKLQQAGVLVDYVCYGGMIHGFAGMGKLIETGNRAVSHIAATLRQTLR